MKIFVAVKCQGGKGNKIKHQSKTADLPRPIHVEGRVSVSSPSKLAEPLRSMLFDKREVINLSPQESKKFRTKSSRRKPNLH